MSAAAQLALWVGRKGRGVARLRWGGRQAEVLVGGLQILGVRGDDADALEEALAGDPEVDWFARATEAVNAGKITQNEANAAVKRAVAELLREFLAAPDATVSFDARTAIAPTGLTISYPHLITEMVLGQDGDRVAGVYLPEPGLVMRRLPDFSRRVGVLGLTEQAIAVLSRINDVRTASEIAESSPHGRDMALRLLAAATGAGLTEASPRVAEPPLPQEGETEEAVGGAARRFWRWLVVLLLLAAVAVVIALARPWERHDRAGSGGPWGIAVDMGCQPTEVERLYRRQGQDRDNLRLSKFANGRETCFRLVWGHYRDRPAAEQAMKTLPDSVIGRGFAPHVVMVEPVSP
jgi:hypothetical protein